MGRFFVSQEFIQGNFAVISGTEAHHILNVLRLRKGDTIEVFDGSGKLYYGQIIDAQNKQVKIKIVRVRKLEEKEDNIEVTLVQALPRKNRMDYIIEKCTELGVNAIVPIQTARTIVRLDKKKSNLCCQRWQRIAREAAKQCGRTKISEIRDLTLWPDILPFLNNFDLKLLACLDEKTENIKDVLRRQNKACKIAILIGPEGDFTPEEIEQALSAGCIAISLGANVLKTDTAAISVLSTVNYEFKL